MRTPALAALLLLAACGKPLLYAEVEIPSAVVKVPQQTFPSTFDPLPVDLCPADPLNPVQPGDTCLQKAIVYDLGKDFRDLVKDAASVDLRLTSLSIDLNALDPATNPLATFANVVRVRVLAEGVDASTPPIELARYVRDPAAPAGRAISVGARSTVNLGGYVQSGFIRVRAELEVDPGGLPAFSADVTGDFYLKVLVDWGKKAGVT